MKVEWKRKLHTGGQLEAFRNRVRFKVLACGTRWGKTHLTSNIVIDFGLKNSGLPIWWVAPTYELAEIGREKIFDCGDHKLFGKENKQRRILPMITKANIQFKSADNPDSLLGKGVALLVIDECARISNDVYHSYLRRTLLDHKGPGIYISTPKGKNWFYDLYLMGKDPEIADYQSFHHPSWDNPLLDKDEIRKIKETTPEMVFRQEYGAEFLEDASTVFRNIGACVGGQYEEPKYGHTYIIGTDVAKHKDFWVDYVIDVFEKRGVAFRRSQKLDWKFQTDRLEVLAKKYNNAKIRIDSTGVGDPIFEDLKRRGLKVEPYQFGSESKRQLIENLQLLTEQESIRIPHDDVILDELKGFEVERMPSGKLRYSASSGRYDDCVIGVGLAFWEIESMGPIVIETSATKREAAVQMGDF